LSTKEFAVSAIFERRVIIHNYSGAKAFHAKFTMKNYKNRDKTLGTNVRDELIIFLRPLYEKLCALGVKRTTTE
jgi:hypothetical protein